MSDTKLEDIVSLAKRRGFIFPGSDVYGGLSGTWDYGPLGVALKRNIMQLWWKTFVEDTEDMYGVDAAILMNQKVWQASGHVDTFTDPLVECLSCHVRQRADKLIDEIDKKISSKDSSEYERYFDSVFETVVNDIVNEYTDDPFRLYSSEGVTKVLDKLGKNSFFVYYKDEKKDKRALDAFKTILRNLLTRDMDVVNETMIYSDSDAAKEAGYRLARMSANDTLKSVTDTLFLNSEIACPNCGKMTWSAPRAFNMMFKTNVGPVQNEASVSYLRPETAQGIFTNFKNVVDSYYPDVPFGIAQQGKAFRNEISPRDFIFRSREFEQMEIEYFVHPDEWEKSFEEWIKRIHNWCDLLGLPAEQVHELEVPEGDRAHYSKRTVDFEFDFPIGREELLGLAYRTDFDLQNIQKASRKSMEYRPRDGGAAFVPHVIEPSFGVERALMAVLSAAYTEDEINGERRIYLKLPTHLAPVKVAVLPLAKNKPELVAKAREVYAMLKKELGAVMWVDTGNIGKNYRKMDEIGTPYCVTVDFDTLEGENAGTVTIRHRDTTTQERVATSELIGFLTRG